jgi:hypothetical protein
MRLQEILKENLEWYPGEKEAFMSLKGLVNKNNGVFKSRKQQWYIKKNIVDDEPDRDRGFTKENFGVDLDDGEKLVTVEAVARWASYGARSQVPVRYGFVMDDIGVVKFYKIGNQGNLRDGAGPDAKKTKLEWTRPDNVDASHLEKSEEEKKKEFKAKLGMSEGNFLGTEGERMKFDELTLTYKRFQDDNVYGYNNYVSRFWHVYKDANDNVIYYTGKEGPEVGTKVSATATVKKHLVSKKGDKVTVIMRPRFKLLEPETAE